MTKDAEKTALEKQHIGKTLQCSCGNSGFLMTDVQGSKVESGFRQIGGAIVCQSCGKEHKNSI